ncbi:MAG: hypothetical protein AMXMBFR58_31890 [Phycisphaerae bacterium]
MKPLPQPFEELAAAIRSGTLLTADQAALLVSETRKRKNAVVTECRALNFASHRLKATMTDAKGLTYLVIMTLTLGVAALLLVGFWYLAAFASIGALMLFSGRITWYYRKRDLCQHCKYDLTNTPAVSIPPNGPSVGPLACSECGTVLPLIAR